MINVVRLDDTTDHGGQVISASEPCVMAVDASPVKATW